MKCRGNRKGASAVGHVARGGVEKTACPKSSVFKGVSYNRNNNKFRAQIWKDKRVNTITYSKSELDAAWHYWRTAQRGQSKQRTDTPLQLLNMGFLQLFELVNRSAADSLQQLRVDVEVGAAQLDNPRVRDGVLRLSQDLSNFSSVNDAMYVLRGLHHDLQQFRGQDQSEVALKGPLSDPLPHMDSLEEESAVPISKGPPSGSKKPRNTTRSPRACPPRLDFCDSDASQADEQSSLEEVSGGMALLCLAAFGCKAADSANSVKVSKGLAGTGSPTGSLSTGPAAKTRLEDDERRLLLQPLPSNVRDAAVVNVVPHVQWFPQLQGHVVPPPLFKQPAGVRSPAGAWGAWSLPPHSVTAVSSGTRTWSGMDGFRSTENAVLNSCLAPPPFPLLYTGMMQVAGKVVQADISTDESSSGESAMAVDGYYV